MGGRGRRKVTRGGTEPPAELQVAHVATRKKSALGKLCGASCATERAESAEPPSGSAELSQALAGAFGLASGSKTHSDNFFRPAVAFAGARSGCVFKRGVLGLGYYLDAPPTPPKEIPAASQSPSSSSAASSDFAAAAAFGGARSGHVFKLGAQGLGYYRDPPPALAAPETGASTPRAKLGFRFGGDNRERCFRAYCERSIELGTLDAAGVDGMLAEIERCGRSAAERGAKMMQLVEEGLRGREVVVVGATGRTPRGWWGDESVGRVLAAPRFFDEARPELLPVRVPVRSTALGSSLGEAVIPEVLDVGIRAVNLRLRVRAAASASADGADAAAAKDDAAAAGAGAALARGGFAASSASAFPPRAHELYDALLAASGAEVAATADGGVALQQLLDAMLEQARPPVEAAAASATAAPAAANVLSVQKPGSLRFLSDMARHVLPLRLSIEHLWSGEGKTRLIERCCQLDLLQVMKPLSAWPGQGPKADYVVNLGPTTRAGATNPQLATWDAEAADNPEFGKLLRLKAALAKRGVHMLPTSDSLFMRLYAALAFIPSHRDEGRRRLRVVGNSGRDRRVGFALHSVGDFSEDVVESAERLETLVAHGWAYALTNCGSGREPIKCDVPLPARPLSSSGAPNGVGTGEPSSLSSSSSSSSWERPAGGPSGGGGVSGRFDAHMAAIIAAATGVEDSSAAEAPRPPPPPSLPPPPLGEPSSSGEALVDLAVAHEVQPTAVDAPLTMAWVVDLDESCCGGDADLQLRRYQEAVLEVMLASGMTLDGSLEPPQLPKPFLYRPFEAQASAGAAASRAPPEGAQPIDKGTRFLMQTTCGSCGVRHWLPAQEGPGRSLVLCLPPALHAPGCALAHHTHRLRPSLKRVGAGYKLPVGGGGAPWRAAVRVQATERADGEQGVGVRVAIDVEAPHVLVDERQPVD